VLFRSDRGTSGCVRYASAFHAFAGIANLHGDLKWRAPPPIKARVIKRIEKEKSNYIYKKKRKKRVLIEFES